MANLILVPGSGHGSWYFDPIATQLLEAGHKLFAVDLTGLDYRVSTDVPINLDTHINDVLSIINDNSLDEVALIAHSYGGMVITGVADRTSAKISAMVYLDAMLPKPGERLWQLIDDKTKAMFLASVHDGFNMTPDENYQKIAPRVTSHPLATMLQPLHYSPEIFVAPKKTYVFAEKYFGVPDMNSPFKPMHAELVSNPDWQTYSLPLGHDLVTEAPGDIAAIILDALKP